VITVLLTKYYSGDQIRKGEMDGACGSGEVHTGFWRGNMRKRDYLEGPGVDGKIILKWIFKK
jgi:hypothetical protein